MPNETGVQLGGGGASKWGGGEVVFHMNDIRIGAHLTALVRSLWLQMTEIQFKLTSAKLGNYNSRIFYQMMSIRAVFPSLSVILILRWLFTPVAKTATNNSSQIPQLSTMKWKKASYSLEFQ